MEPTKRERFAVAWLTPRGSNKFDPYVLPAATFHFVAPYPGKVARLVPPVVWPMHG